MSTKFVKNLAPKLYLAWIMAEIERSSFQPLRASSKSEEDDAHESQHKRRRRNASWCVCQCCATWEVQQNKEMFLVQGDRGSREYDKISVE